MAEAMSVIMGIAYQRGGINKGRSPQNYIYPIGYHYRR